MSSVAVACLLLLLGLTSAKQEASLWSEAELEEPGVKETKVFTIESVLSTVVSTVYHTVRVYPTCTATVEGVPSCVPRGDGHLPDQGHFIHPSGPSSLHFPQRLTTQAPSTTGEGESSSSSFSMVEVVLPSCDCVAVEGGRSPRRLLDQFITLRSTTTLTEYSIVTRTDPSTTVSITYGGCLPTDAITTDACHR